MGCGIALISLALTGFLAILIVTWVSHDPLPAFLLIYFSPLFLILFIVGLIAIIMSRRKLKIREPIKGEGELFNYNVSKCPNCGSSIIEGGIIYKAKTEEEKQALGYRTKWQRVCLKCKTKWIAVEK
ncbi:hypothetical protein ACFLYS_00350 [Chloroflexota bacterium]